VRPRRTSGPWLLLGAIVVAVLAWAAWPSGSTTDAERVAALARQLRCPDCESLSAADSQTASARAIRRDLEKRVAAGQSDAAIRQTYVDRYGSSILLDPGRSGLGLVLWVLPVLVVAAGIGALVLVLRRGRTTERLEPTPADEALVRELRGREGSQ
jgi:cytochrome c-type biogenesis protein CcmH/NrfF